ncbi:MAG: metallophosphoesterase [Candidatus Eisenbacteria bacterium]|jgi:Icc-related predicted phosphoesterase|nr:metallophosphoesterase [Candidatus Eisenbacteria bacterium]
MPGKRPTQCLFVTDIHGSEYRYRKLFDVMADRRPDMVFLGGDLLPSGMFQFTSGSAHEDFINGFLAKELERLKRSVGLAYPRVFAILGNDDARFEEAAMLDVAARGLWHYAHSRRISVRQFDIYGYSFVPPTPFLLKDWERYDVSRYVDPGCISPEEGFRSVPMSESETMFSTISQDLAGLTGDRDLSDSVFLFHSPPYKTALDRAGLDGKMVDHVPMDVHVGSIAISRFIQERQPLVTMHGHIHESARLTGSWRDVSGRTQMFTAAHDGPELALVSFTLEDPAAATRELL